MQKLNLTPEEIYNTEFKVDFKGYSPDEVDNLLDLVLEDYGIIETNIQELLDTINSLQKEVKELKAKNVELLGAQKAFDLSNSTNYSSVDILKRISRLEQQMLKK